MDLFLRRIESLGFSAGTNKNNLPEDVMLVSKYSHSGCTSGDMIPKSRQGPWDVVLLRKLGMTKERMMGQGALFFYHN
jgi:hypothetical protein